MKTFASSYEGNLITIPITCLTVSFTYADFPCRISGLPSPIVYSLMGSYADTEGQKKKKKIAIKSAVLDSCILNIVSTCLFDVTKGVQYLYQVRCKGEACSTFFVRSPGTASRTLKANLVQQ